MRKQYKIALRLLSKSKVNALPVDPLKLGTVTSIFPYSKGDKIIKSLGLRDIISSKRGIAIKTNGGITILYEDDLSENERRFVIAHELGHIYSEHFSKGAIIEGQNAEQEEEADLFALYLLAPPCVLRRLGKISPSEIATLTGLTADRSRYISHLIIDEIAAGRELEPLERQVAAQFLKPVCRRKFYWLVVLSVLMLTASLSAAVIIGQPDRSVGAVSQSISACESSSMTAVYVTLHGEKYHKADCVYIKDKYTVEFNSAEEAEDEGYKPCKVCLGEK